MNKIKPVHTMFNNMGGRATLIADYIVIDTDSLLQPSANNAF